MTVNNFQYIEKFLQPTNENDFWLNRTLLVHSSTNQIEFESFQNTNDNLLNKLFNQSYCMMESPRINNFALEDDEDGFTATKETTAYITAMESFGRPKQIHSWKNSQKTILKAEF